MPDKKQQIWRYYCPFREPGPGCQPPGAVEHFYYDGRPYVSRIRHAAWGHLDYDRELTESEIRSYELIKDPENPLSI